MHFSLRYPLQRQRALLTRRAKKKKKNTTDDVKDLVKDLEELCSNANSKGMSYLVFPFILVPRPDAERISDKVLKTVRNLVSIDAEEVSSERTDVEGDRIGDEQAGLWLRVKRVVTRFLHT